MARVTGHIEVTSTVQITLTESEARSLRELVRCGVPSILNAIDYITTPDFLKEHKGPLQSFFYSLDRELPSVLHRLDAACDARRKASGDPSVDTRESA